MNRALSPARLADKEKPPRRDPGGKCESSGWRSALDGVAPLPILTLGGGDGQPHFLADRTRQEAAHRMRLPIRGFHDLLQGGSAGPFQQFQNLFGLAPWRAPVSVFGSLRPLALLAPCFGELDLFPDLRFEGATCGFCARVLAFLVAAGFWAVPATAGIVCSSVVVVISHFSFRGDGRGHDMDRSGAPKKQANSAEKERWRRNRDGASEAS